MSRHVRRILGFAVAHFVVAMVIAIIAFGPDMDQVPSRSGASRVAAPIHDVLWTPHDSALRLIPNAWLIHNTWVIPLAVVVNSLVWGAVLYALWESFGRLTKKVAL